MTRSTIQARREALIGSAHYVQFYGSWYCINFESGRASRAKSQEHAISIAERKNAANVDREFNADCESLVAP